MEEYFGLLGEVREGSGEWGVGLDITIRILSMRLLCIYFFLFLLSNVLFYGNKHFADPLINTCMLPWPISNSHFPGLMTS